MVVRVFGTGESLPVGGTPSAVGGPWPSLFSLLLYAVRILPAVLVAQSFDTTFFSGCTNTLELAASPVLLRTTAELAAADPNPFPAKGYWYWEVESYTGFAGLALLVVFELWPWTNRDHKGLILALPNAALSLSSVGRLHIAFRILRVPLLSTQRQSSRVFLPRLSILDVPAGM